MVCFDHQRREAEDLDHFGIPTDSAERREAAAILRAAHLDPLGPAPMEAVFDSREEAAASSNLIVVGLWAGEWARTVPGLEAEAAEAESLGRLSRAARAWGSLAGVQTALGRLADARQSFERAQGLAARLGTPVGGLLFTQAWLSAALDEGWEEAAPSFGFIQASDNPAFAWAVGLGLAGFAQAKAHVGEADEALAAVGRLMPWLERAPAWTMGFGTMACAAAEVLWFLERTDHLDAIEAALREKLLPPDFRIAMADGRHALARCCALSDRYDEAARWFAEARLVLAEQGAAAHLAICDFDEALMHLRRGGPGDASAAGPLLKAAFRQFEAIGMSGWLRRAHDLEATLPQP